jgi:hypothetical protein
MRPEEINRNVNLAFKRFFRRGNLFHFAKCKKHLEKRLEWFRVTDPEEVDALPPAYPDGDVRAHLEYISDRWNSVARIKFLLKVIETEDALDEMVRINQELGLYDE